MKLTLSIFIAAVAGLVSTGCDGGPLRSGTLAQPRVVVKITSASLSHVVDQTWSARFLDHNGEQYDDDVSRAEEGSCSDCDIVLSAPCTPGQSTAQVALETVVYAPAEIVMRRDYYDPCATVADCTVTFECPSQGVVVAELTLPLAWTTQGFVDIGVSTNQLKEHGIAVSFAVHNAVGETVWTDTGLTSSRYGDGAGAISYIGPCDSGPRTVQDPSPTSPNLLQMSVDWLESPGAGTRIPAGDFVEPPALERVVPCPANGDVYVPFDIALAMRPPDEAPANTVALGRHVCEASMGCGGAADLELEIACLAMTPALTFQHDPFWIRCDDGFELLLQLNDSDAAPEGAQVVNSIEALVRDGAPWVVWRLAADLTHVLGDRTCRLDGAVAVGDDDGFANRGLVLPEVRFDRPFTSGASVTCEPATLVEPGVEGPGGSTHGGLSDSGGLAIGYRAAATDVWFTRGVSIEGLDDDEWDCPEWADKRCG
ncbi:MAG: hypothetical protein ACI9MR_000117 [Myxococcota bacterium]|jgi:hypothetical protein